MPPKILGSLFLGSFYFYSIYTLTSALPQLNRPNAAKNCDLGSGWEITIDGECPVLGDGWWNPRYDPERMMDSQIYGWWPYFAGRSVVTVRDMMGREI